MLLFIFALYLDVCITNVTFYFYIIVGYLYGIKMLKVVSTTFLLVCFVCLRERICETRKNVLYFTSKTLFVFEIIKF